MAKRKSASKTPERSKIDRERDTAFAKRTRPAGEAPGDDDSDDDASAADEPTKVGNDPSAADTSSMAATRDTKELPTIEPPPPRTEPWPDATPQPMKPVEPAPTQEPKVERARTETVSIPKGLDIGRPPAMPRTTAPPPLALGQIENPTHMPGPRDIPGGNPDDPAPAPGRVPPGDSRSLRRAGERQEFALIYRLATYVITRWGVLGTRGQWRVVEYPTSSAASHSYAKECSRFVSDGFSDYRE